MHKHIDLVYRKFMPIVRYQLTDRAAQRFREETGMDFPFLVEDLETPKNFIKGILSVYGLKIDRISRTERSDDEQGIYNVVYEPTIDMVFHIDVNNGNGNGNNHNNGKEELDADFFDAYLREGWIIRERTIRKDKHRGRMDRRRDSRSFSDVVRTAEDHVYN